MWAGPGLMVMGRTRGPDRYRTRRQAPGWRALKRAGTDGSECMRMEYPGFSDDNMIALFITPVLYLTDQDISRYPISVNPLTGIYREY